MMVEFQVDDRVRSCKNLGPSSRLPANRTFRISQVKTFMGRQTIQLEGLGDFYFSDYFTLILRGVNNEKQ